MTLTEPVPHLHSVDGPSRIDLCAAEDAVRDLLVALGRDPRDEHLADTPRRVADAYAELLSPQSFQLTTFPTTSSSSSATSPFTRSVSTTSSPSPASHTSATSPGRASSACP